MTLDQDTWYTVMRAHRPLPTHQISFKYRQAPNNVVDRRTYVSMNYNVCTNGRSVLLGRL